MLKASESVRDLNMGLEIYSELLSGCHASSSVTLMDQGGFYDGMHTIPPPGQKDETSVWSQTF